MLVSFSTSFQNPVETLQRVADALAGLPVRVLITLGDAIRTDELRLPANAVAERWVGTVRRECLDWLLILGPRHLEQVLREYVVHYNAARPHRALELRAPLAPGHLAPPRRPVERVVRRDRVGGLIHEYEPVAA